MFLFAFLPELTDRFVYGDLAGSLHW